MHFCKLSGVNLAYWLCASISTIIRNGIINHCPNLIVVSFLISAETYYTLKERPILTMFIHCIYIYILDHTCLCKLNRYPHYSTLCRINNNSKCYLDYICLHDNFSSKFKKIYHAILSYNIIHFWLNELYLIGITHTYYMN